MIGTGQNISSIGATPYVPYSAIELVDNIIMSAGMALIFLVLAYVAAAPEMGTKTEKLLTFAICLAGAIEVISVITRIWL